MLRSLLANFGYEALNFLYIAPIAKANGSRMALPSLVIIML